MPKLTSILLVDDDSTTNFLNKLLINRLEITEQLLVVENGAEALALLQAVGTPGAAPSPALVLLDVNMPVMNGLEFLEAYQLLPPALRQTIIIVLLTTSVNPRDLSRVAELPVAGTLTKPLTEEKLRGLLRQHFPAQFAS